jgi:hypothetical protein
MTTLIVTVGIVRVFAFGRAADDVWRPTQPLGCGNAATG